MITILKSIVPEMIIAKKLTYLQYLKSYFLPLLKKIKWYLLLAKKQ